MNIITKPYKSGTRPRGRGARSWMKKFTIYSLGNNNSYPGNYDKIDWGETRGDKNG